MKAGEIALREEEDEEEVNRQTRRERESKGGDG